MDIILINPPWTFRKQNIWKDISSCIPPIGLAQIASYLEKHAYKAVIWDMAAESLDSNALKKKIIELPCLPSFIGITSTTSIFHNAVEVAGIIRNIIPEVPIIMGGVHPTLLTDEVMKHSCVDYCIRGEGEQTLLELISGNNKMNISGLSFKKDNVIIHNPDRPFIENIDALPLPAYHLLPMHKYHPALGSYQRLPGIGMITTRGCPGRCTFCNGQYMGKRIRFNSANKILNEIKILQKDYNIKEISFYDDTFTAVKNNVLELCKLIIAENIDITWSCFSRVDFVDKDILKLMKKAGCHQICYGVESRDETILKNMNKKISFESVSCAIKMTKEAGIETRTTFMLGSPGETEQSMLQTINYACELNPDIALFNITTPYPGTEMFSWASENNLIKTRDWSCYDLSQPVMEVPGLSAAIIMKYYRKAYLRFYVRFSYIITQFIKTRNWKRLVICLKVLYILFGMILNRKHEKK
ncbi:MAG: radical SAM protein [uncultured bacterium]|nr:MAG: radical SAM protein [uncultured bacterium]